VICGGLPQIAPTVPLQSGMSMEADRQAAMSSWFAACDCCTSPEAERRCCIDGRPGHSTSGTDTKLCSTENHRDLESETRRIQTAARRVGRQQFSLTAGQRAGCSSVYL